MTALGTGLPRASTPWMLAAVNVVGSMKRSNWTKNPLNWGTPVTGSGTLIMVAPPGAGRGMVRGVATPIVLLTTRGPPAIRKGAIRILSRFWTLTPPPWSPDQAA